MEGGWVAADVDQQQLTLWNEVLFAELTGLGVTVRTRSDVAQVLGLERQRQLLGCGDDASSCTAEIAEALNADGIIKGSTGRSGSSLVLNVRVLSPSGEPLAVKSWVVPSADAALAAMKPIAQALVEALAPRFPGRLTVKAKVNPGLKRFWWAPAALAVVAAGVGAGLQVSARGIESDVRSARGLTTLTAAQDAAASGRQQETLSLVAFGVAGAAAVGTVLLLWLGQDTVAAPPAVTVAPTLNGAVLTLRWP